MLKVIVKGGSRAGATSKVAFTADKTLLQLVSECSTLSGISQETMQLLVGYPPARLEGVKGDALLSTVGVRSGDTVVVVEGAPPTLKPDTVEVTAESLCAFGFDAEIADEVLRCIAGNGTGRLSFEEAVELAVCLTSPSSSPSSMIRHVIPADNSCLFGSIVFCAAGKDSEYNTSRELRLALASLVERGSAYGDEGGLFSEALLGKPPLEYAMWIRDEEKWGGEIEMSLVTSHLLKRFSICAVDVATGVSYRYNEAADRRVIFLLYDGIHFDAITRKIILETASGSRDVEQTSFPSTDLLAFEGALAVAAEAQRARQFVSVGTFTLRCLVCGQGLVGQAEAQAHAKATSHPNYAEY